MSRPHELDALIGYHLRRASSVVMADLAERLSGLGLRTTEAAILVVLSAEENITQSEIGRRLSIKRANMAPLIAALIARGLIVRGKPIGRAHPLTLSRKGKTLGASARTHMDEHDADFFGNLPVDQQKQLVGILSRLWRHEADA